MTPPNDKDNGSKHGTWGEWANFVLKALEKLDGQHSETDKTLNKLVTEIRVMQTKMTMRAALSGALASAIPVAIGLIIWFITRNPPAQ